MPSGGPLPGLGPALRELPEAGLGGHRGGCASHPENTLAAFREAARLGAAQIELDVRASADGARVVIHDERVDRTTDGRGLVRQLRLDEIRRLDAGGWKHPDFAGERVPTLSEALAVMPKDVWINVQIQRAEPVAEAVARDILDGGREDQAFVACGNRDAERVRRVHPSLRVCNLARQRSRAAYVEHALATGSEFVQFHWLRGDPEPELVRRARAAGLRINHCCSPDAIDVAPLLGIGVQFPLVDDLVAARRALDSRAGRAPW